MTAAPGDEGAARVSTLGGAGSAEVGFELALIALLGLALSASVVTALAVERGSTGILGR